MPVTERAMAILSSLLAALLLAISCSAAACATACDRQALASAGSAYAGSSMAANAMPGMTHCSAPGSPHAHYASEKTATLTAHSAICLDHPVCGSLAVFSVRDHTLRTQLLQLHAATTLAALFSPLIGAPAPVLTTPPLRTPSLAALQTTLRI